MQPIKNAIAADLKAAGYKPRQVSIRLGSGGGSTKVNLVVRDPQVVYSVVEAIAQKHRHVDRDAKTGEILSGGNTYVDIALSDTVYNAWTIQYLPAVNKALTELTAETYGVPIDKRFTLFRDGPDRFKVWDEYHSWLRLAYRKPEDLAVELYVLSTGTQAKVTSTAVFRYWGDQLAVDKSLWQDNAGHYDVLAMGEAAAEQFQCASDDGDTDLEIQIRDWAADFITGLPKT